MLTDNHNAYTNHSIWVGQEVLPDWGSTFSLFISRLFRAMAGFVQFIFDFVHFVRFLNQIVCFRMIFVASTKIHNHEAIIIFHTDFNFRNCIWPAPANHTRHGPRQGIQDAIAGSLGGINRIQTA